MTPAEWSRSNDGEALLHFASERIPIAHLCLVLGDLTGRLLHRGFRMEPVSPTEKWPAAWGMATLRAWSFGAATRKEVVDARNRVQEFEWDLRHSTRRMTHVGYEALSVSLQVVTELDRGQHEELARRVGRLVVRTYAMTRVLFASFLRARIAFPVDAEKTWEPQQGTVIRSGRTLLRIKDWGIADVVALDHFGAITPDRAVAFDEALTATQRMAAPDLAAFTGCVGTLVDMGGQLALRISCYDPAPRPSPPQRSLPLPLPLPRPRPRALPKPAPRALVPPPVPAFVPIVEVKPLSAPASMVAPAATAKPAAKPIQPWRWVSAVFVGGVWFAMERYGLTGEQVFVSVFIAVPTLLGLAAAPSFVRALWTRPLNETLGEAFQITVGLGFLLLSVGSALELPRMMVHGALDISGYETRQGLRDHQARVARLTAQVAAGHDEDRERWLKREQRIVSRATVVSESAGHVLSLLSLVPLLMLFAVFMCAVPELFRDAWSEP